MYDTIRQMHHMLGNLDRWLVAAREYADRKKFDPNVLLQARLAPDQFAFARQVQAACDHAKFAAARLSGKTPPSHPDTEQTLDELHARVASTRENLASYTAADFGEERVVALPRWDGRSMKGEDYLRCHALPNFYFHVTTAYAILRHNGVDLGKRDFLGQLPFREG